MKTVYVFTWHLLCSQKFPTESGRPERDARVSWWITDLNFYQLLVVDQDGTKKPLSQCSQYVCQSVRPYNVSIPHLSIHLSAIYPYIYHLYASLLSIYHLLSSTYLLSITFIINDHTFIIYNLTVYPSLIYPSRT